MKTITVMDPVTRIEGHMKVEVAIDTVAGQQQVVDVHCTGTLFRGFETLLKGRIPLDAPIITQRICGVCPVSHGQASVLALENVSYWLPNTNARLLRNLTLGANFIQSHILHFYLLAALDFVDGPSGSPWAPAWQVDMRSGLADVSAHLPGAITARRKAHEMAAILCGRMPNSSSYLPGGFTSVPSAGEIDNFQQYLEELTTFITDTYIPDVEAVGNAYSDYFEIGKGCENLMAYGVFEMSDNDSSRLFPPGYCIDADTEIRKDFTSNNITEAVKYSWYSNNESNLTPMQGETNPQYPKSDAYSWLKAPRLSQKPFEVGPLARMWVGGKYQNGISVMDRHVARALEAQIVAQNMADWLNDLTPNQTAFERDYEQYSGVGVGMTEAPRGALGHWVEIEEGRISKYQVITPTCWNASPRDDRNIAGPMEQAILGTPVEDPDQPIEVLRIIHSYDPCLSCAVHIMRPDGKPFVAYTGKG